MAARLKDAFLTALMQASGGRIVPAPGGVLIRDGAGDIIGAVGISGDTSDKDEACGVAVAAVAGLCEAGHVHRTRLHIAPRAHKSAERDRLLSQHGQQVVRATPGFSFVRRIPR